MWFSSFIPSNCKFDTCSINPHAHKAHEVQLYPIHQICRTNVMVGTCNASKSADISFPFNALRILWLWFYHLCVCVSSLPSCLCKSRVLDIRTFCWRCVFFFHVKHVLFVNGYNFKHVNFLVWNPTLFHRILLFGIWQIMDISPSHVISYHVCKQQFLSPKIINKIHLPKLVETWKSPINSNFDSVFRKI